MEQKICSVEDCGRIVFARGWCQRHYMRHRSRGTLERIHFSNDGPCMADGCERKATTKGMCTKHYQQSLHPLRQTWKNLRTRSPGDYPASWESFDVFLADVGERPSTGHQLRRPRVHEPWGPGNFVWREPMPIKPGKTKEERAEYARVWRDRKVYDVDGLYRARMFTEQDGKCPICLQVLGGLDKDGKILEPQLDHDHFAPFKARGLLTGGCNAGLGFFEHDPERMRRAADYMEYWLAKHATEQAENATSEGET